MTASSAVPQLDTVAVGSPITRLGVSFFPVYLPDNHLPAIVTGEASGLVVDELDQPSVQALRVRNPGDKPVLVVEGEHFLGGKQNRAVNDSVLVSSLGDLEIPVSCLERGRWGRRRAQRRDEAFAPARVRRAQHAGVAESMRRSGSRDGDQSAVWREVDQMLKGASVHSATAAASDLKQAAYGREPSRAAAVEQLAERGPLDTIDEQLAAGRTVYVHCWGGVGRTGVIVGCWLARHGRRGEEALERLRELWRRNPKSLHRRSPERAEQEEYVRRWPPGDC